MGVCDFYEIKKLTDRDWVNLYEVLFRRKGGRENSWLMCSRKSRPIADVSNADAVLIIATVNCDGSKKLVVTKEFRVPIWDYEYGFPAGLIDDGEDVADTVRRELKEETGLDVARIEHISMPVYSSAGMTDESCHMVMVEAEGEVSDRWLEEDEDIEVFLLDAAEIKELLASNNKIAAKAWGVLYHFAQRGEVK